MILPEGLRKRSESTAAAAKSRLQLSVTYGASEDSPDTKTVSFPQPANSSTRWRYVLVGFVRLADQIPGAEDKKIGAEIGDPNLRPQPRLPGSVVGERSMC